jgi:hypothetical protein
MKADSFKEVMILMIRASLFVKLLKEQFRTLIGLNFFMVLASGSFGIKVNMAKFILKMSRYLL